MCTLYRENNTAPPLQPMLHWCLLHFICFYPDMCFITATNSMVILHISVSKKKQENVLFFKNQTKPTILCALQCSIATCMFLNMGGNFLLGKPSKKKEEKIMEFSISVRNPASRERGKKIKFYCIFLIFGH